MHVRRLNQEGKGISIDDVVKYDEGLAEARRLVGNPNFDYEDLTYEYLTYSLSDEGPSGCSSGSLWWHGVGIVFGNEPTRRLNYCDIVS